jgi:hypothetical protein
MGWFDPAVPVHIDEIRGRGIPFDFDRYCRPYIRAFPRPNASATPSPKRLITISMIAGRISISSASHGPPSGGSSITSRTLNLRTLPNAFARRMERLREGLLDCASEVLFLKSPDRAARCSIRAARCR